MQIENLYMIGKMYDIPKKLLQERILKILRIKFITFLPKQGAPITTLPICNPVICYSAKVHFEPVTPVNPNVPLTASFEACTVCAVIVNL